MNARKIKQRINLHNGKWLRYATPRKRNGIIYLENAQQFITAYGKPDVSTCDYGAIASMRADESHELRRVSNITFQEVDKSSVVANWAPGDPEQMMGRVTSRQDIPDIELNMITAERMDDGRIRVMGRVDPTPEMPSVSSANYEVVSERGYVSLNMPAPQGIESEAYKKAMEAFIDSDRNSSNPFIHVDSVKQGEDGAMIANVTMTPRTPAEVITIQKIKDGK